MRRFGRISSSTRAGWWLNLFASSLMLLSLTVSAAAQGQTSRYVYDDDGRLRAVIAPNGEAAVYEYDSAGNFTAIRRLSADDLELLTFAPRSGVPGTQIVFYGVGFGAGVSAVTFSGGVTGTLVGFTNNTITAVVPQGAVTGPVVITTARGTLTTATPFVIQGVIVTPKEVSVLDGESVQFNATVIVPGDDQEVSWSVNGIEGGSETLGKISDTGLYTGPADPAASFDVTIRAVSLALPTLEDTAIVHVRSLSDFRFTLSQAISIGKGEGFTNRSALSLGVSIGKGKEFGALSPGVSVAKGEGFTFGAMLSRGVSLGRSPGSDGAFSPSVMLTNGPIISTVSPASIVRGSNTTVTLNGSNFSGINSVSLLNLDGSTVSDITSSNINVNANGTSLTVTLSVQSFTSLGRKIIVVTTPTTHSVRTDLNVNTIQVTAP